MNPQRFLVAAGFGSRRQCDKIIASGRVLVNGKPLGFGISINEGDEVRVDGRLVSIQNAMQRQHNYIALNKPDGLSVWIDGKQIDPATKLTLPLEVGSHKLSFAVDLHSRTEPLRVELTDVSGSVAQAQFVGGK